MEMFLVWFCNPVLDILEDKLTLVGYITAFIAYTDYAIVVEQQQIHTYAYMSNHNHQILNEP